MLEVNRSVSNVRVGRVPLKDRPIILRFSAVAQGSIFRTEDSSNISVSISYLDEMIAVQNSNTLKSNNAITVSKNHCMMVVCDTGRLQIISTSKASKL